MKGGFFFLGFNVTMAFYISKREFNTGFKLVILFSSNFVFEKSYSQKSKI